MNRQNFKSKLTHSPKRSEIRNLCKGYSLVTVLIVVAILVVLGALAADKLFDSAIKSGEKAKETGTGFGDNVNDGLAGMSVAWSENPNDRMLRKAVMEGNTGLVKIAVKSGANVNLRLDSGATLLHRAVSYGLFEIAQMLVENGADVDAKNKKEQTPLHWAARKGRIEIVKFLIQNYADFDIEDIDGKTPLNVAVSALDNISKDNTTERQKSVVDLLRSYGAKE